VIAVIEFFENGCRQQFAFGESLRQRKMAKYRHSTFEMFDFVEEATCALNPKSSRRESEADPPGSWTLQHLIASQNAKVIHVKFKKRERLDSNFRRELRADFSHLADSMVNDSRLLLDFEGLSEFGTGCIDELRWLTAKLKAKGSRMVLCNLQPAVRASFFPPSPE
jgi:anti-anti-sigma regulatory factor